MFWWMNFKIDMGHVYVVSSLNILEEKYQRWLNALFQ